MEDEESSKCKVLKLHDDGDMTVQCGGSKFVLTTEGEVYKEATPLEAVEASKEPWMMTKAEYDANVRNFKDLTPAEQQIAISRTRQETGSSYVDPRWSIDKRTGAVYGDDIEANHWDIIRGALSEGKPIPPEVLKDYPDLEAPVKGG